MEILQNETLIGENLIGTEKFTITDKRIIYTNQSTTNVVGVKELRTAQAQETLLKFNKFNLPAYEGLAVIIAIPSVIAVYIYLCTSKYGFQFGDIVPLIMAIFSLLAILPVALIVIYGLQSLTSFKDNKTVLHIIKTDNTYWANQYYDPSYTPQLQKLVNDINLAIYR